MSKSKARWSNQHLTQLRSQIESFKQVINQQNKLQKPEEYDNLSALQVAVQRSQAHEKSMESYRNKFEDYDLDYTRLAGKHTL